VSQCNPEHLRCRSDARASSLTAGGAADTVCTARSSPSMRTIAIIVGPDTGGFLCIATKGRRNRRFLWYSSSVVNPSISRTGGHMDFDEALQRHVRALKAEGLSQITQRNHAAELRLLGRYLDAHEQDWRTLSTEEFNAHLAEFG